MGIHLRHLYTRYPAQNPMLICGCGLLYTRIHESSFLPLAAKRTSTTLTGPRHKKSQTHKGNSIGW
jgi:hypothetical protein